MAAVGVSWAEVAAEVVGMGWDSVPTEGVTLAMEEPTMALQGPMLLTHTLGHMGVMGLRGLGVTMG